jgi:hypothetical protein
MRRSVIGASAMPHYNQQQDNVLRSSSPSLSTSALPKLHLSMFPLQKSATIPPTHCPDWLSRAFFFFLVFGGKPWWASDGVVGLSPFPSTSCGKEGVGLLMGVACNKLFAIGTTRKVRENERKELLSTQHKQEK